MIDASEGRFLRLENDRRGGSHSLIIIYAIMLHYVWSVSLYIDESATGVTAINSLHLPPTWAASIYFIAASAALLGLVWAIWLPKAVYMLPQQFVMLISAGGALQAMLTGRFADGILRPIPFLVADQSPAIIAAILHTYAIIAIAREDAR